MFKVLPDDYYVASLDDDVTMSCEGMGQPKPKIIWKKVSVVKKRINFIIYFHLNQLSYQ